MYNEKLEQLIEAALMDGVLTEKEKQVLFKNAQAMGVDLDEFEMVLNARLYEMSKGDVKKKKTTHSNVNFKRVDDIVRSLKAEYKLLDDSVSVTLVSGKTKAAAKHNADEINRQHREIRKTKKGFVLALSFKGDDMEYDLAVIRFIRSLMILDFSKRKLKYAVELLCEYDYSPSEGIESLDTNESGLVYHFYEFCKQFETKFADSPILEELPDEYRKLADMVGKFENCFSLCKSVKKSVKCLKWASFLIVLGGAYIGWWSWWYVPLVPLILVVIFFLGLMIRSEELITNVIGNKTVLKGIKY